MNASDASEPGLRRAWDWVEHLRSGGTTPWAVFTPTGADSGARDHDTYLPGAIQLETARRLNLAGRIDDGRQRELVDHVLGSSGPGRGQPDLDLLGAHTESGFGPPPVDPAQVPVPELLRMAIGSLADLVVASDPGPSAGRPRRARRPWRPDWRIHGDPLVAGRTRRALLRAGHGPGLRAPIVVVVADDLAAMLADTWAWRVRHTMNPAWRRWLARWAHQDKLPRVLDLPTVAARQAEKVGVDNVHVVLGPHPMPEVARLLGVRRPPPVVADQLSPVAVDLVRHVNVVLRVLVPKKRHQHLLDSVLLPALAGESGARRTIPKPHREWVRRRAARMRDELRAAGYPVHGDVEALVPGEHAREVAPSDSDVLDVALRTLLKVKEKPE